MTASLEGQVAIVTGGGRGFGERLAIRLAAEGASVTAVSRSMKELQGVVERIRTRGGQALAVTADVTDQHQVAAMVSTASQRFGPATLLVNCAGIDRPFGPIGVVNPMEWWASHAVHVLGPLLCMSAVIPAMRDRQQGCIINIASRGGVEITPNMSAYGVGKATEIRLTEHVAAEWRDCGIVAFAIEPGTVITAMGQATLDNPDAHRWIPGGIAYLKSVQEAQKDPGVREAVFRRCGDMVVALASGKYNALSGRYLDPQDDFDSLLSRT
jgi:NAD(P)-dependent dehydrogenase (short-subunit alcohol dehydrogenase family)